MAPDPQTATALLIDSLGASALTRAADYTAGGHWILLWNLVSTGLAAWLAMRSGVLAKLQNVMARLGPNITAFVVALACFPLMHALELPWSLYASWWRERLYDRSAQPLVDFLAQGLIGLGVSTVVGAIFVTGIYALIRRAGERWWLWSGGLAAITASALMLVSPIVIEPLFNEYRPLPPGEVRQALEGMATQAGVPADRLFVYDGSRQSNNFTANVAGLGGSARIAISDVAFKGASLEEVKAVTGHEIGHYVSGHVWRWVALVSILAVVALFAADRLFPVLARLVGSPARLSDPSGLPIVLFIAALFSVLSTPVTNAVSRAGEREADRYSLETVNLPDALATALVKTAEYRDPRPHWLQETLFYTHPSVESRVLRAMQWKAGIREAR